MRATTAIVEFLFRRLGLILWFCVSVASLNQIRPIPSINQVPSSADVATRNRREFVKSTTKIAFTLGWTVPLWGIEETASASSIPIEGLMSDLQQAKRQLQAVPKLIQMEQWDSVRAILIAPPLSDLWTKSRRPTNLLLEYARVVGEYPAGDEFAVLQAKEEVEGHLRFLDMAVYNNVFNPIKAMGETGATKELIRSYYDDPINEYKAIVASLDELIELGNLK